MLMWKNANMNLMFRVLINYCERCAPKILFGFLVNNFANIGTFSVVSQQTTKSSAHIQNSTLTLTASNAVVQVWFECLLNNIKQMTKESNVHTRPTYVNRTDKKQTKTSLINEMFSFARIYFGSCFLFLFYFRFVCLFGQICACGVYVCTWGRSVKK